MERLRLLVSREEIERKVRELADLINRDYRGKTPHLVGVLTGSFIFLADLVRLLTIPLTLEFVRVASYGAGRESSGEVKLLLGLADSIEGRDVLVVEDIVDSGYTADFLMKELARRNPASLKLCVLFDKPSRRKVPVRIDYRGFEIPDVFVVGYGLDLAGRYRNLPDLYILEEG